MNALKTPGDILKEEHQAVIKKLERLENAINHLELVETTSQTLVELNSFFDREFWVHFDKEERALFPEFDSFIPRGVGPLQVMLDEHEVLRNTYDAMREGVTRYLCGANDLQTLEAIRQKGSHFVEFLRDHIFKEDSILFKMAEMHLDEAQNAKVVKLFAEIAHQRGISSA